MIQTRLWIPIFLAGCTWAQVALGQAGGEPAGAPGSAPGSPAGSPAPTPTNPNTPATPGTPRPPGSPAPAGPQGPANPFAPAPGTPPATPQPGTEPALPEKPGPRFGPAPAANDPFGFGQPGMVQPGQPAQPGQPGQPTQPGSPFAPGTGPGASSNFGADLPRNVSPVETLPGTDQPATKPKDEGQTYTAPGFYGTGQQTFTAGQGRFARPRFRYSVSASMGFDDNIFQTTENARGVPDQVITQVIPGEPEIATFVPETTFDVRFINGAFRPVNFRTTQRKVVLRPAVPERTIETVIPGFEPSERQGSVISSIDGNFDMQWVKSRSLFTLDLRAGAEYYWNRESDPLDWNGSIAAVYVRRLSSRAQMSGNLSINHQTSPDYNQVNLQNTANTAGEAYTTGNLKFDLSYRWASRFSTATSLSANTILYEGARSGNNFYSLTLGNELRYMDSRRLTYIAEARYNTNTYLNSSDADSATLLFLLGFDYQLSQRILATLRLGESLRTFKTGEKSASPYGEMSLNYMLSRRNIFALTSRYGFEEANIPEGRNIATRLGLTYTRLFSPRFSTSLHVAYIDNAYTFSRDNFTQESSSTTYDLGLSGRYIFNRHFSLSARYNYSMQKTDTGLSDFDRGRFFLTGQYEF